MSHEHSSLDDLYFLDPQTITLSDWNNDGYILDIGGGGEGVIGQLKGDRVIAIDRRKNELEEAPPGGLKIVMDATDLRFLDDTFATATAFFTLMYIRDRVDGAQLFAEVYRVLQPGGQFLIWDAILPTRPDTDKDIVGIALTIHLPERKIETGYGTRWPDEIKDVGYYCDLAASAGFDICQQETRGRLFYLELQKPGKEI